MFYIMHNLSNANFVSSKLQELEKFHSSALRNFLQVDYTTANYILYLEFGSLNISTLCF